jgi:hypothetical protein
MLGLLTTGRVTHPERTYLLYDQVRSAAVHGERPPAIDAREVRTFAWDIRIAINEFLQFAADHGLVKRARVRQALDADERRQRVVDELLEQDPDLWRGYLAPARDAFRVTLEAGTVVTVTLIEGGDGEPVDDPREVTTGEVAVVPGRSVMIVTDETKIIVERTRARQRCTGLRAARQLTYCRRYGSRPPSSTRAAAAALTAAVAISRSIWRG